MFQQIEAVALQTSPSHYSAIFPISIVYPLLRQQLYMSSTENLILISRRSLQGKIYDTIAQFLLFYTSLSRSALPSEFCSPSLRRLSTNFTFLSVSGSVATEVFMLALFHWILLFLNLLMSIFFLVMFSGSRIVNSGSSLYSPFFMQSFFFLSTEGLALGPRDLKVCDSSILLYSPCSCLSSSFLPSSFLLMIEAGLVFLGLGDSFSLSFSFSL